MIIPVPIFLILFAFYAFCVMWWQRWLGTVLVRPSDFWSTDCEFNSWPCTAGLLLGRV